MMGQAERSVHCHVQPPVRLPPGKEWLAPSEREAVAQIHSDDRRQAWLLGRWAAKHAVVSALDWPVESPPLERIEIHADEDGAPAAWMDGRPAACNLSISHRDGWGFCAVAGQAVPVGCDIELVEPRSDRFVGTYLTAGEQVRVKEAAEAERPLLANLIWSAKQSTLKALRCGLTMDTRAVEVCVGSDVQERSWHPLSTRCNVLNRSFEGRWFGEDSHVLTYVRE